MMLTEAAPFVPKAYAIERRVFGGRFGHLFDVQDGVTLADQAEVVRLLATEFGVAQPTVVRRRGAKTSNSWAHPGRNLIALGATAGPAVVCHEFAHLLAPPKVTGQPWHGAEWQKMYAACVALVLGDFHARRLARALGVLG